jgi:hypothetical protein
MDTAIQLLVCFSFQVSQPETIRAPLYGKIDSAFILAPVELFTCGYLNIWQN